MDSRAVPQVGFGAIKRQCVTSSVSEAREALSIKDIRSVYKYANLSLIVSVNLARGTKNCVDRAVSVKLERSFAE